MELLKFTLQDTTTVAEVLNEGSQAIDIFTLRRMACVGCRMEKFCTLREAAMNYEFPIEQFLPDLRHALQS